MRAIALGGIPIEKPRQRKPRPRPAKGPRPKGPSIQIKLDTSQLLKALGSASATVTAAMSAAAKAEGERIVTESLYGHYMEYGTFPEIWTRGRSAQALLPGVTVIVNNRKLRPMTVKAMDAYLDDVRAGRWVPRDVILWRGDYYQDEGEA